MIATNPTDLAVTAALAAMGIHYSVEGGRRVARTMVTSEPWECYAWRATFTAHRHRETFDFYCGLGHATKAFKYAAAHRKPRPIAPSAAIVLYSLLLEAGAASQSFKDWCDDYGYNANSISSFDTYSECTAIAIRLARLFMPAQLAELSKLLENY